MTIVFNLMLTASQGGLDMVGQPKLVQTSMLSWPKSRTNVSSCAVTRSLFRRRTGTNWKKIAAPASQSELSGLPPTKLTSIHQGGSRNQDNQSVPQASAPSYTTSLGDHPQQGLCNPSLPNTSGNRAEEDTVDKDTVEHLISVASPVGYPNNRHIYPPLDIFRCIRLTQSIRFSYNW
jgi:hypothetical protein